MLVGKDHCWWERIMLAAEDHVGGEESCWWERIMLVVEHGKCCRIMISAQKKTRFLHRTGHRLSVRNKNRSKLYASSPPTFFLGGVGVRE